MSDLPNLSTLPPGVLPTRRDDLVEELGGHHVADPYRWLEQTGDPDVRDWVIRQTEAARAYLDDLPARPWFASHLDQLWDHPRRTAPWRRGGWWFQLRNDGLQNQDVLWCAAAGDPSADGEVPGSGAAPAPRDEVWRVLVDPNAWSEDGTAALTAVTTSDDGQLVAIGRSDAGSDWTTWQVVTTATGAVLPDTVPWSKFSGGAWLPDGSGFLYGAFDPPEGGREHVGANQDQKLRLHRLGDDPAADEVVYERPDQPEWGFDPLVSHDGRWLFVHVWHGTRTENRIHLAPIADDGRVGAVRPLLDEGDAAYRVLGVLGHELVVRTDLGAPLGRIVAIDLDDPSSQRELVAEAEDRLEDARLVGAAHDGEPGWLVCHYLHHATSRVAVHDAATGAARHEIALPGPGTVTHLTGGRHDTAVHLAHESFTTPARIVHHALEVAASSTVTPPPPAAAAGADELITDQVHVHHDGVAIPLFLVHRRDVRPDGAVPTVLWGYGGFDIAVTPLFRPGWRAWVDAGGLLAVACLRGGGEYGRPWHDAGRLANKQHVFDDALACAAWLTGQRSLHATALTPDADPAAVWTAPHHLGIEGRSNGGLLVGACITQAPEAFGSAVPEVGVHDLARFHRFTIGWAWTSDYGDPDDPDDLARLLVYSPYHNAAPAHYPPTLITTGDTDDRVVPAHSYKFAAALQYAQSGTAPILLRVDLSAGHGSDKPVRKLLEERTDVLAFHAHQLGLDPRRNEELAP